MKLGQLSRTIRTAMAVAGVLVLSLPLYAQLQIGDNLDLHLSGTLSAGYSGDYGNLTSSDHSIGIGGTGTLSGYYFNPNFISFTATPYYDQARDNSTSRSISNSSGVDSEAQIFSGSHFPASISYSKSYNSEGSFDVPGLANFTTHGNSDSLGLAWSERLPGWPSFSVSFQKTGSQNSIYGASGSAHSSGHSLNFGGSYRLGGFGLGGSFYLGSSSSQYPELLAGTETITSSSSTDHGYTFTASHRLPWNGSFYTDYTSSTANSNYLSTHSHFTVDNFNAGSTFQPTQKLQLSASMEYSDNLSGSLEEAVITAGGTVMKSGGQNPASHAYNFTGGIGYAALTNLHLQGTAERRIQQYNGTTYGANTYSGSASYWHYLFGGRISSALTLQDATVDNSSQNSLGFNGTTTYNRRIAGWSVDANFNYAQSVETLLVTYTNSQYGYGGGIRRRWGQITWSLSGGASSTGLTSQKGATSQSKSASTGLGLGRWASLGASYSESSGNGILTGAGISTPPTNIPPPALPTQSIVLYGGKSYSYSIGSSPIRRLTLSAAYARADSNTGSGVGSSTNITKIFNTLLQYQFRKMYITGGYSQLTQGFSVSGTVPQTISSFYIGISRWFNFF